MGHLYRALNLIDLLAMKEEKHIVIVNPDAAAQETLRSREIAFETVDLADVTSNWETRIIKKHRITVWINDRLDTDSRHALNVKNCGVKLVTFDDNGTGADHSDLHVAALAFSTHRSASGKTLQGIDYLVLNREIANYRRLRTKRGKILVTLGGSDTYGATIKVVQLLKEMDLPADIHIGPSFGLRSELESIIDHRYRIIGKVPSLIETFFPYDLAITGGGITPFEANASGLPCVIVANELFEIENGRYLQEIGSSVFAGHHEQLDKSAFARSLDIETMSRIGMSRITLQGADNVYKQIQAL